jgi:hypothetical protein
MKVTYSLDFLKPTLQQKINVLQEKILEMPQADILTTHTFKPNVYERAIRIPAWTVLTGAEHKTDYKIRLEKGTIAVNVGDEVKVLTAPCEFEAKAGAQRVGRVFEEDVIWVDVYDNPDNCKDIAELERRLYDVPACGLGENRVAEMIQNARNDYNVFVSQLGLSQEQIDEIVQIESDLIEMPAEYAVKVKDSKIHGKGLFATKQFEKGEIVCPGRIDGKRTPAGRFINHSFYSNIVPTLFGDDIVAIASRKIYPDEEILVDYRTSVRVNFGIALKGEIPCQVG